MTTTERAITPPAQLEQVYGLLTMAYGKPTWIPDHDPLGGLVGTILSQHTSDINSGRAYQQLVEVLPTWEAVRDAPTELLAHAIRSGGLANVKAPRIQAALQTLTQHQHTQRNTDSLAGFLYHRLQQQKPEEAWHYLRSIPGVGPKTAACVLMFNMGMPVMPVDTHVHRVSKRLGIIRPTINANQAHEVLARITPPTWVYTLHVHLIRHGRQVCHAQRPDCAHCPLFVACSYAGSMNPHEEHFS